MKHTRTVRYSAIPPVAAGPALVTLGLVEAGSASQTRKRAA